MRTLKSLSLLPVIALMFVVVSRAEAIENQKGKVYSLNPKHGPWMIMVASFRDVRDKDRKTEGMTAEQASAELVFELREKGIPAYTYSQSGRVETIETVDRLGRDDQRIFAAQRDMICVLAGNYESIDDAVAQKTLAYVKKFNPQFMKNPKNGAVTRVNAGQRGPLSGAFMTINPLRSAEDLAVRRLDPETKYLNSGIDHALIGMKKKYTIRVATFTGKTAIPMAQSKYRGDESKFDRELSGSASNIVRGGEDAAQLTRMLRQKKIEAYVFHDKFQSIVTVGGFDSKDDPGIQRIMTSFQAKNKPDPNTNGQTEVLTPETLSLPNEDPAKPPRQVWVFDNMPELIEVPRVR